MFHARPTIARPKTEPVSSAMHLPGCWRLITDGDETLAELLCGYDQGLDELGKAIELAIHDQWPLLLVLPMVSDPDGWRRSGPELANNGVTM